MAQATEDAKQVAQEAAGQAQEKVQEAAGQARDRVREQVDTRSTQAGQQVRTQADDLRTIAGQLRAQGKDQPAQLATQAAERAERLGGWLEQSDADRILHDVEDFARRQPWVVGLGAAALGLAGARLLKASSSQRYQQRSTSSHDRQRQLPSSGPSHRDFNGPTTGVDGAPSGRFASPGRGDVVS